MGVFRFRIVTLPSDRIAATEAFSTLAAARVVASRDEETSDIIRAIAEDSPVGKSHDDIHAVFFRAGAVVVKARPLTGWKIQFRHITPC